MRNLNDWLLHKIRMVKVCVVARAGAFRPFKVIQGRWIRCQSKARTFPRKTGKLPNSNIGPILHRFGATARFMSFWPHPYSILILGMFPLHQIAHVGRQRARGPSAIRPWNYFRRIQTYLNTVPKRYRQTDRRTTCNLKTALCVASRGKNWPQNQTVSGPDDQLYIETWPYETVQGDRSIDPLRYIGNNSTRGVKKSSTWRLQPKLGSGCISFTLKNSSEGLISNPCAYLIPKSITPVSPQQVCNKLAWAKVRCVCCVVSFPKFHYNNLLPTSWQQVGNFPVLLQQVLDGCFSCNTSCDFIIIIIIVVVSSSRSNNDRRRSTMSTSKSRSRSRSRRRRSGTATK